MEEQRKFKILKSRLESMNYKYPFTMESFTLIEALLNDVFNLNQALQKLRSQKGEPDGIRELSERIEYLNREKIRLEDEISRGLSTSDLENRDTMTQTISELKRENKLLNQRLNVMQAPKRETVDTKTKDYIDKLFNDCNLLRKQLEDSEDNTQKLLYENRSLQDRLLAIENDLKSTKKELEISLMTIKDITTENRSTNEEFYSYKKFLASYESKFGLLESDLHSFKSENQKLQQYNRSLEQQVSNLNKENSKSRNEIEILSSSKVRQSSQIESLQRQLDVLQNENNKLHSLRDEDKSALLEIEKKYNKIEDEYAAASEKIRVIQRENQGLCETIRDKGDEIRNKDQLRKTADKEIRDLKVFVSKYEDSIQENKKYKQLIEDLSFEVKKFKKELDDSKENLKFKEEEIRQYRSYLEQANKEIDGLKRRIDEDNIKLEGFSMSLRNNTYLEEQLKLVKLQFEESNNRERQLHGEIDSLRSSVSKTEEKLGFSLKNCQQWRYIHKLYAAFHFQLSSGLTLKYGI